MCITVTLWLVNVQVSKLQSVFASVEAFPVSEPMAQRSSGLRFAAGHPYGALRGYRGFSGSAEDGSSLSSGQPLCGRMRSLLAACRLTLQAKHVYVPSLSWSFAFM